MKAYKIKWRTIQANWDSNKIIMLAKADYLLLKAPLSNPTVTVLKKSNQDLGYVIKSSQSKEFKIIIYQKQDLRYGWFWDDNDNFDDFHLGNIEEIIFEDHNYPSTGPQVWSGYAKAKLLLEEISIEQLLTCDCSLIRTYTRGILKDEVRTTSHS